MSDYMPTTEDVRRAYREHCRDYDAIDGLATSPESYEEEFDQWRALDRAEAQVEVLNAEADYLSTVHFAWKELYVGILRDRADRIAREAGIETGESNEA